MVPKMSVTSKVREQGWSKTKVATATEETGFGEMVKWEAMLGSFMFVGYVINFQG